MERKQEEERIRMQEEATRREKHKQMEKQMEEQQRFEKLRSIRFNNQRVPNTPKEFNNESDKQNGTPHNRNKSRNITRERPVSDTTTNITATLRNEFKRTATGNVTRKNKPV